MSLQFGIWNFAGHSDYETTLDRVRTVLDDFASDGESTYSRGGVTILYRPFPTVPESHAETQPSPSPSGAVLVWDGRLDNRKELSAELGNHELLRRPDTEIVVASYGRWGTDCFSKLLGDWALSLWNPAHLELLLARDPVGVRHLYYTFGSDQVCWSTVLDPLVDLAKPLGLDEEYIAGCLSSYPNAGLTPYVGIRAVPPSCFVRIRPAMCTITRYWGFDSAKQIRYGSDGEYEEHFREVFRRAVARRLRSDRPVLLELSGGVDSSAIVCMADDIVAQGASEAPRLETLTYFDGSEPHADDRWFSERIEAKRGRAGFHLEVSGTFPALGAPNGRLPVTPRSLLESCSSGAAQFARLVRSEGYRTVLSGLGGDELTGGVPTAIPEIEDLVSRLELRRLARQLKLWALTERRPWFHVLGESVRGFFPPRWLGVPRHLRPPDWLCREFVTRNRTVLTGYLSPIRLCGPAPSFQESLSTFEALRGQIASSQPSRLGVEKRYPYLDRDLVEFVFGVPREQLVRPNQRRSLVRRALGGMVPDEVLNRNRKAYVARSPIVWLAKERDKLLAESRQMLAVRLGIVHAERFCRALETARSGRDVPAVPLLRTILMETWLRDLAAHGAISGLPPNDPSSAGGSKNYRPSEGSAS